MSPAYILIYNHPYSHIKGVERQNTGPFISALEILLAKVASKNGIRIRKNCYFFPTAGASTINMDLGGALEVFRVWKLITLNRHVLFLTQNLPKGFYSSVRPTLNSLMINVNVCYTAFYKPQRLSDALNQFVNASFFANPYKFVESLRVQAVHVRSLLFVCKI